LTKKILARAPATRVSAALGPQTVSGRAFPGSLPPADPAATVAIKTTATKTVVAVEMEDLIDEEA
jgi:hypothetical protein